MRFPGDVCRDTPKCLGVEYSKDSENEIAAVDFKGFLQEDHAFSMICNHISPQHLPQTAAVDWVSSMRKGACLVSPHKSAAV